MKLRVLSQLTAAAVFAFSLSACDNALPALRSDTSFYVYTGDAPLSSFAPGTILKSRKLSYHVLGMPTEVPVVQLLYRSTDIQGRPTANVTSILQPAVPNPAKAVSYQSFYDSLNPADSPSRSIAGDVTMGGLVNNFEVALITPLLERGYTVVVPDTQGQRANFAAGPEYGYNTLDSLRAATASADTGLNETTRVGLIGYSGGAIATNWAASLAPTYAPDVNDNLVGFAEGGLLVAPSHNLRYVEGSAGWAGIVGMAVVGVGRSFDIDFTPYVSDYGKAMLKQFDHASIINVLLQFPDMTWQQLVKPEFANPNSIPAYVDAVNRINLGLAPTPSIPGLIEQGLNGGLEGTAGDKPGIGPGDGVMVAGDVRTLARQYCADGNQSISYVEHEFLSHVLTAVAWVPNTLDWIDARFANKPAPSSCGRIPAGNSLAPEVLAG